MPGKRAITIDTALRVSKAQGVDDRFCIDVQTDYTLEVQRALHSDDLAKVTAGGDELKPARLGCKSHPTLALALMAGLDGIKNKTEPATPVGERGLRREPCSCQVSISEPGLVQAWREARQADIVKHDRRNISHACCAVGHNGRQAQAMSNLAEPLRTIARIAEQ